MRPAPDVTHRPDPQSSSRLDTRWTNGLRFRPPSTFTLIGDCPLATHVKAIENRAATDRARDLVNDISQAVRARYALTPLAV